MDKWMLVDLEYNISRQPHVTTYTEYASGLLPYHVSIRYAFESFGAVRA